MKKIIDGLRKELEGSALIGARNIEVDGGDLCALLDEIERLQEVETQLTKNINVLMQLIERLQAERRWIPVSERLPDDDIDVLTLDEFLTIDMAVLENNEWYSKSRRDFDGDSEWLVHVTHWMPLPPPPEED